MIGQSAQGETTVTHVPLHEVEFRTSRSGGPGGQNVNKVETRVEARWSVRDSAALSPEQRARLLAALGSRVTGDGLLRVTCQRFRSQARNREGALARLRELVARGLAPRPARRRTAVPQRARQERLSEKKRRAATKQFRSTPRERGAEPDE